VLALHRPNHDRQDLREHGNDRHDDDRLELKAPALQVRQDRDEDFQDDEDQKQLLENNHESLRPGSFAAQQLADAAGQDTAA
jgi:hypothetical protein